jgi:hypothetical protein
VKLSNLIAETAPRGTRRGEHREDQSEHDSDGKYLLINRYEAFHIILLASLDVAAGGLLKFSGAVKKIWKSGS